MALATAELDAAVADERVVALGFFEDEFVGVGAAGGFFDEGGIGVGVAVGDVGGNGVVKKKGLLGDEADAFADGGEGEVAEGSFVDAEFASGGIEEAGKEVDEG